MTTKTRRGFAVMDPEQRRAIAKLGGHASRASGHAHEFTKEEARQGGKIGGWVVSRDRNYIVRLGRKGGTAKARRKRAEEEKEQVEKEPPTR